MPTSLRLNGNRDRASMYWGEAKRILFQLKNDLELQGIEHGWRNRRYTDGTTIRVGMIYGADIIEINSPFKPVAVEEQLETIYYLRFGMIYSVEVPPHEYQFFRFRDVGLTKRLKFPPELTPPDALTEIYILGTETNILQSPYFLKDNRKHKRDTTGAIVLFPKLSNESFNAGTVGTPHETANWDAYEIVEVDGTTKYFDQWHEVIAIQTYNVHTEDLTLWDVPTALGTRTYTATNTYKITYVDATGIHTTLGFMISAQQGSITLAKTMSGDGFFFLASSFNSSQTANRPTIGTPTALGNLLTLRTAKNLTSSASGSLAAEWTYIDSGPGQRKNYSIGWTGSQSRDVSGPISFYFGAVLVDSANIVIDEDDTISGTTTGYAPTDGYGVVNGSGIFNLPDMAQVYSRNETALSVLNWANIEDSVFALIYRKINYVESWTRTDVLYSHEAALSLWQNDGDIARYVQRCEVNPYPAPTVSDSYSRTDTTHYYLSWRSRAGLLEKVLLATQTQTYTSRFSSTPSGQYVSGCVMNVTKNFMLYAYQIYNSATYTLVSTNFGVININTGERRNFSYTPAQTVGIELYGDYYYYSPTIFQFIPNNKEKQP